MKSILAILLIFCLISFTLGAIHRKEWSKRPKKADKTTLEQVNITINADDTIQNAVLSFFAQASAMNASYLTGRIILVRGFYYEAGGLDVIDGTLTKSYDLSIEVNTVRSGYNPTILSDTGIYVSLSPGSTISFSGFSVNIKETVDDNAAMIVDSPTKVMIDQVIFNGAPEAVRLFRQGSSLVATDCQFNGLQFNSTRYIFAIAITAVEYTSLTLDGCSISYYHNQYPAIKTRANTNVTITNCDISENIWYNQDKDQPQNETSSLIEVGGGSLLQIYNSTIEENGGWGHILKVGLFSALDLQNTSMSNNTVISGHSIVQISGVKPPVTPGGDVVDQQILIDGKYQAKVWGCDFYNPQSNYEISLFKSLLSLLSDSTFYSNLNTGLLVDSMNQSITVTKCIFMSQPPFQISSRKDVGMMDVSNSRIYSDAWDPLGCSSNTSSLSYCSACSEGFQCSDCKGVCVESFNEKQKKPIMCYQKEISSCSGDCLISSTKNSTCTCAVVLHPLHCGKLSSGAIAAIVFCVISFVGILLGIVMLNLERREYERRTGFVSTVIKLFSDK
eukprot:TRINITY_DN2075_c0_g1_i1.p1 TRINITY_DN2075_c0_g1~~TRINITY_DN2075_c0_g1_i1.p1  ORF type:complete len:560 (-),score=120.62 TRINITY_DN2075_c0_g1_i1:130-1809(-)